MGSNKNREEYYELADCHCGHIKHPKRRDQAFSMDLFYDNCDLCLDRRFLILWKISYAAVSGFFFALMVNVYIIFWGDAESMRGMRKCGRH